MRAFRNSQLRLHAECGWAYADAYVRGTELLPSPALHGGRNVHAAIRAAVHEIVSGSPILNIHEIAYRTVRGSEAVYRDALEVLTLFTESLADGDFTIDPRGAFLFEERLEIPVDVYGVPCTFFGTPDLIERVGVRRVRITDWKTHWRPDPEEVFLAHVQLPHYALLLADHYPAFTEFELVRRYLRYRNNYQSRLITTDDLPVIRANLVQEIATVMESERLGDWEPTPGSWCGTCGSHHTCPRIRALREHGIDDLSIPDDDRAREMAGDVVAVEAFAAAMKDRLKVYLGGSHATGFVPLAGGSWGYGAVQERYVQAADLKRVLTAQGVEPPDRLWKVDLEQLDKLKRRLPQAIVAAVDDVITSGTTARCQFRKGISDPRASKKSKATAARQEALFDG